MNTHRARRGGSPSRLAFAMAVLTLFAGLVLYGALLQYVEQTREPVRLKHISEYGNTQIQDAFIRANYGC